MCGIAGVYHSNSSNDLKITEAIIKDQYTRGPDAQKIISIPHKDSNTIFGHNRLSIIDLSENANQPMWDNSGNYCLIYNGQIYNYLELKLELKDEYAFVTTSDTEIILAAFIKWREACVQHFHGMFAFAIYEKETGDLWLFRDRFGVKPLFYYSKGQKLYFASTSKVLANYFGLLPNHNYLHRGLHYRFYEDGSSETAYEDLFSVKPGHFLHLKQKQDQIKIAEACYYDFYKRLDEKKIALKNLAFPTLQEHVKVALSNAIKIRLRADVPIGIALSGGLDSSTLATMIKQDHANQFYGAFSFGDPNNVSSEGPTIEKFANQLNIKTHYVMPDKKHFVDKFWETINAQDAPFPSLSIMAQYFIYESAKKEGVKVLLSGQGADEAFLGYKKFQYYYLKEVIRDKQYFSAIKQMFGMTKILYAEMGNIKNMYPFMKRYLNQSGFETQLNLKATRNTRHRSTIKSVYDQQVADILQFSLPTLLRYEDRNSMANSIESRLPFLDHELIELALTLPTTFKIKNGYGKWIIRSMMESSLPNHIRLARYKRGFDAGESWITGGIGKLLRDSLHDNFMKMKHLIPHSTVIEKNYSDEQLIKRPNALSEAITLAWLGLRI